MDTSLNMSGNPKDYLTLQEISDIILTDMSQMANAISKLDNWDQHSLHYFYNPINQNNQNKYYYLIIAIFDKLINEEDIEAYKKRYLEEITRT